METQKPELLRNLKGTAEGLLAIGTYNVWSTCGGINEGRMRDIYNSYSRLRAKTGMTDAWQIVNIIKG